MQREEFNPFGEIQIIDEGKFYILRQNIYCYQVITKDGHQIFGSYDLTTAKERFRKAELDEMNS